MPTQFRCSFLLNVVYTRCSPVCVVPDPIRGGDDVLVSGSDRWAKLSGCIGRGERSRYKSRKAAYMLTHPGHLSLHR
jgi:hypothetical protein